MDPLTHGVIGVALAKVMGNEISLADAATAAVVVGAVFPDIDNISKMGRLCLFKKPQEYYSFYIRINDFFSIYSFFKLFLFGFWFF